MFRSQRSLGLLVVLGLVAGACSGGGDTSGRGTSNEDVQLSADVPQGGTLRLVGSADVDFMDPAAMYATLSWFLARGVFRTLVTYPGNVTDLDEQNELVPDLAASVGEPNADNSRWTYTLKPGVTYGPALGNESVSGVTGEPIVCEDFRYTFERLFVDAVGAGYPFYYDMIEGAEEFSNGDADEIAGIECPSPDTIVFNLTEPVGDWDFRMAMPAASPVPRGAAERYDTREDSNYDNHVVATGPYYIEEWEPAERITLARNPDWDPSTDEVRHAYVDAVDWRMGFENDVAIQSIVDDEYDVTLDIRPSGPALENVLSDPELTERLIVEPDGCNRFVYMNTTVEPFDDAAVRAAVNVAIDRENLLRIIGGSTRGEIATSILPPGIEGALGPEEFNPYETPNMAGDIERARQMLADAGYPDGFDGDLLMVGASGEPDARLLESVRVDLEALGFSDIEAKPVASPNHYTQYYSIPEKNVAIGTSPGWCKDYNSAVSFFDPLFRSSSILESGNNNFSEVDDPRLDGLIDEAAAESDPRERIEKWAEANRYATEQAYFVPWLWQNAAILQSSRVVNGYFFGFTANIDWVNVGVRSSS
ncbi:MAG: ABC transporter substrate-binding protein [Actinomycetota bacterium]